MPVTNVGTPSSDQYAGKDKFYRNKAKLEWTEETAAGDDDDDDVGQQENVTLEKRFSSETISTVNLLDERLIPYDLIVRLLEKICFEDPSYESYSSAVLVFMPGMGEIRRLNDVLTEHRSFGSEDRFRIYPLHSTISSEQQGAVFDIPPPGVRKIVIGRASHKHHVLASMLTIILRQLPTSLRQVSPSRISPASSIQASTARCVSTKSDRSVASSRRTSPAATQHRGAGVLVVFNQVYASISSRRLAMTPK